MSNPSLSVSSLFEMPGQDAQRRPVAWREFENRVAGEVKGINWTTAMPDLTARIAELFDVQIPDVLIGSWKKIDEIRAAIERTSKDPEGVTYVALAEHTIESEHHPSIEILVKRKVVKRLEFIVRISFQLQGYVLRIERGRITAIETGTCQAEGTIEYEGLRLAEKKLEPVHLPGSIRIENDEEGSPRPTA
jgi:hypothetical protein